MIVGMEDKVKSDGHDLVGKFFLDGSELVYVCRAERDSWDRGDETISGWKLLLLDVNRFFAGNIECANRTWWEDNTPLGLVSVQPPPAIEERLKANGQWVRLFDALTCLRFDTGESKV